MGFTRYWYIDENLKQFPAGALKDVKVILNKYSSLVKEESNSSNPPIVQKNLIRFNGIGENGHETFYIELPSKRQSYLSPKTKGRFFGFCKTAQKPYDIVVKSVLLILKKHLKDKIDISSDG